MLKVSNCISLGKLSGLVCDTPSPYILDLNHDLGLSLKDGKRLV